MKEYIAYIIVYYKLYILSHILSQRVVVVIIPGGQFINEQVKAWLGIPYAEPPVGMITSNFVLRKIDRF